MVKGIGWSLLAIFGSPEVVHESQWVATNQF